MKNMHQIKIEVQITCCKYKKVQKSSSLEIALLDCSATIHMSNNRKKFKSTDEN